MHTDQLKAVDAVVRLGGFSAAARDLNKVPSAISYNIKSLEDELGILLFDRQGYRAVLTEPGRAVYRAALAVLTGARHVETLARELTRGVESLIRLDISPVIDFVHFLPALRRFRDQFPATQLHISSEVFGGEALVLEERVDMAISEIIDVDDRLERVQIGTAHLVPVAAGGHLLSRIGALSRSDLINHVQVVVESRSPKWKDTTLGVAEGAHIWRVPDFAMKRRLLVEGLGWGHMPLEWVQTDLEQGRLVQLNLETPVSQPRIVLVRKQDHALGPAGRSLWQDLAHQHPVGPTELTTG